MCSDLLIKSDQEPSCNKTESEQAVQTKNSLQQKEVSYTSSLQKAKDKFYNINEKFKPQSFNHYLTYSIFY